MKFKNFFVKILTFSIICAVIVSTNVYASSNENYLTAKSVAEQFFTQKGIDAKLNNPVKLYNFNNEVKFLMFSNKDSGYIVVDLKDFSIPEFSPKTNNTYITNTNKKYIYNGPLSYFEEDNNKVVDVKTKKSVGTFTDLKGKQKVKNTETSELYNVTNSADKMAVTNASATTYENHFIQGTLPSYAYNPNGICGSTAAAMFAGYYDNNSININYIPTNLESSDGVEIIKTLVPFIEGIASLDPEYPSPGSTTEQLRIGFQNYLRTQDVDDYMYSQATTNYARVSERTGVNRPLMVDLDNHPTYGEHWVVTHGYQTEESIFISKLTYLIVNDGWGNKDIYIDVSYCDDLVW
jgi:hypothetical protein